MLINQFFVGGIDHLHELLIAVFLIGEVMGVHHSTNIGLYVELVEPFLVLN